MHAHEHARVRRITPFGISHAMQARRADALHVALAWRGNKRRRSFDDRRGHKIFLCAMALRHADNSTEIDCKRFAGCASARCRSVSRMACTKARYAPKKYGLQASSKTDWPPANAANQNKKTVPT